MIKINFDSYRTLCGNIVPPLSNRCELRMRYRYPRESDILVATDDLWAFAWSAPMRELAEKIGISDVGLKKLLQSHGVSTPPQGYWTRLQAGKPAIERLKAPARRAGETGRVRLDSRFANVLSPSPPIPVDGPFATVAVPESLEELREAEIKALGRIAAPRDLDRAHVGLVQLLRRQDKQRAKFTESGYEWEKPTFDTPLGQRRLRLLNGIFFALAKRNHTGDANEHEGELHARAIVGETHMSITFDIVGPHKTVTVYRRKIPAPDLPASTPLSISIDTSFRREAVETWRDDEDGKLETKLALIAAGIIVAGEVAFRRRLKEDVEHEEEHRRWKEEARRERLAVLEAKRLEDLKKSGELLRQAEEIRAVVQRVKAAVQAGDREIHVEDLSAWEAWALGYADRIDPVKSGQVLTHVRAQSLPGS